VTAPLAGDGLRKAYGALTVTDGVSLTLRPGECHALIGPNGAGKTTLMRLICGEVAPDAGRVRLAGRDVTALSVARRARLGLGRTFQITSVAPGFSARENAALAAQAADHGRWGGAWGFWRRATAFAALNDAADAALATVGLQDRADTAAAALSHGERRLLELAMALAARPRLLLLDEPMAGMGKGESAALTQTLARLKTRIPMLLVEHDMEAVFALADRVSVLVYGRIAAEGTPAQVRADPAARAAYLGEDAA
jgi:branched-chain amino acid transport system ATP-binding protein